LIGRTLDDAAGEACDKFAKMLGLPYPGGALLDRLGRLGAADPRLFPRPHTHVDSPDFSFSGLKTAAAQWLAKHPDAVAAGRRVRDNGTDGAPALLCDVCASYLLAIAETLRMKLAYSLEKMPRDVRSLIVAGGVAANSQVRSEMQRFADERHLQLVLPALPLCTDNAVMIAQMGWHMAREGFRHCLDVSAIPRGQQIPDDHFFVRL
jgi:N6-L-threonylcarbamoyladenine synthase